MTEVTAMTDSVSAISINVTQGIYTMALRGTKILTIILKLLINVVVVY